MFYTISEFCFYKSFNYTFFEIARMYESTRNLSIRKPNNMEIFRQSIIDAIAKSMKALQITFLKTVTESIENFTLIGLSYLSHTTFQGKVWT